jgi:MFS family permease
VPALDRTEATYRLELRRAVANGVLESAGSMFLLLIAVRCFEAGATAKALVTTGGSVGLMLTPVVVSQVAALGWPAAQAASRLAAVGAGVFILMAAWPWLPVYVLGSVLSMAAASSAVPLLTQIYQENYPETERGKLFSRAVMVRIASAALFSQVGGQALSVGLENFRWLLLVFAVAFAFASRCLARYPSQPLTEEGGSHPFRAMRFAREDRLFRQTLICWMLMGFANLMMLPMRVEYLANPKYDLNLDVSLVALLIGVIPNMARLAMSQVWGWLFDRTNFFVLRVTLNGGFALGILTFFLSDSIPGLVAGAIVYGVSSAGGDVAWGLWVTKFAAPERVADYMSVHTFFTGVRGVVAPLVAFHVVQKLSLPMLGGLSAGLIVAASLLLLPEVKFGRQIRRGRPLLEEVSE